MPRCGTGVCARGEESGAPERARRGRRACRVRARSWRGAEVRGLLWISPHKGAYLPRKGRRRVRRAPLDATSDQRRLRAPARARWRRGGRPPVRSARAQERNGSNGVSRTPGPVPARPSQPAGAARRGVLPRAQPPRESLRRPMPGRAWRTAPCCCPPPAATLPVAPVRAPLLSQQRPRQATGATAGALSRLGARACAAVSSFQGGDAARGAVCESERADGGNACMMINIHYSRRGALQSHVRAPAAA